MNREELLVFMKGRISNYYYDILTIWTLKRKNKFLFFKRKFDIRPTIFSKGYIIYAGFDSIIVYND